MEFQDIQDKFIYFRTQRHKLKVQGEVEDICWWMTRGTYVYHLKTCAI